MSYPNKFILQVKKWELREVLKTNQGFPDFHLKSWN